MNSIHFSFLARDDLISICEFIALESPQGAKKFLEKIHKDMKRLSNFPEIGHKRSDLTTKDVRFWRIYNYLIVYKVEKTSLEIVRILSGFRDIVYLLESPSDF